MSYWLVLAGAEEEFYRPYGRLIREHNITIIAISNAHETVLYETSHFCARQRKQMGDEKRYELFSSEKFQVDKVCNLSMYPLR